MGKLENAMKMGKYIVGNKQRYIKILLDKAK